jgi:hypothetical protein
MNAMTMVLRTTTTKSVVTSAEAFWRKRFFMGFQTELTEWAEFFRQDDRICRIHRIDRMGLCVFSSVLSVSSVVNLG